MHVDYIITHIHPIREKKNKNISENHRTTPILTLSCYKIVARTHPA